MTPDETVVLARYVRALCPQQAMDEYTPNAWHDILHNISQNDARAAAARVAQRQPFVAPAEILTEVRALHEERLEGFVYEPVDGDDDVAVYLAAYRAQRAAVANGDRPANPTPPPALTTDSTERLARVLDGIGRTIPTDQPEPHPARSPLTVRCPKCAARLGHHCRWPGGGHRPTHAARKRAARGELPADTEQTA
ncbi:hypothetical protein [Streptomyces cacaoi]|uniref:hypothetical protein n=1 Tax=Streptomyces cacaoi TaxID=1898 RepID=UPI0026033AE8|nr:hypothetical protein [Streptomyces cacaoi]